MGIVVSARIHRQNADGYCGAASAQMALAALGMDPSQLPQKTLFDSSHHSPWYSRPDLLTDTLNNRWQNGKNLRFRLYCCADQAGMLGVMRGMFEQFGDEGAVAIATTMTTSHWVVVRGFETHPDDPSTMIGLHVRNPMPSIGPATFDHQHAEDDDCCGEHGNCPNHHYLSVAIWNRDVPPVKQDGPWKDKFLVICPDAYVPGRPDEEPVPPTLEVDANINAELAPPFGPIFSTEAIAAQVERIVAGDPLLGMDWVRDALNLTRAGTPILVEGLSDDGGIDPAGSYYLVPFLDENGDWGSPGSVPMAMAINPYTGEFDEVVAAPDGSIYHPDWISPAGIERQASSNNLEPLRNRAQQDSDFPYLAVWRHTEQTPTRFWPLFVEDRPAAGDADAAEDDAASRVIPPVYMRIDGQVITSLDDLHP